MLPYRIDQKMTAVLSPPGQARFTLSAEVIPPRNGSEQRVVMDQIAQLIAAGAEFLSVTKGAGGSLRGGSLPIAQAVKERFGVPCIAHFTCRDLNRAEVENLLMDHHYFGIRNILALRGDPPDGASEWRSREDGHTFAYQLIEQIRNLNQGRYLAREGGPQALSPAENTDFCIGAAVYPEHPKENERVEFFQKKIEAGAEYGITDMLFDPESYARFLEHCDQRGLARIPVIPGTRLLKTKSQAARMSSKFKVRIPEPVMACLSDTEGAEAQARGLDLFLGLVGRLRKYGAPGIHLFVISDTEGASNALKAMRSMGY